MRREKLAQKVTKEKWGDFTWSNNHRIFSSAAWDVGPTYWVNGVRVYQELCSGEDWIFPTYWCRW